MHGYNLIVVFDETANQILMCKRKRNPYKGMSNFVGGKIEENENGLDAAYRELEEETSITKNDIVLSHLMDFTYYLGDCYLEVYVGRLDREITVNGNENELYWSTLEHNFFDVKQYAGEGNIGHILMHLETFRKELLK